MIWIYIYILYPYPKKWKDSEQCLTCSSNEPITEVKWYSVSVESIQERIKGNLHSPLTICILLYNIYTAHYLEIVIRSATDEQKTENSKWKESNITSGYHNSYDPCTQFGTKEWCEVIYNTGSQDIAKLSVQEEHCTIHDRRHKLIF